jgi:hypothetical protein
MNPRIEQVRHIRDHILELTFADGAVAQLDFRQDVVGRGGIFTPLEDVDYFKKVRVDPEAKTIAWPNEVDFCPDVLYHRATGAPLPGQASRQVV